MAFSIKNPFTGSYITRNYAGQTNATDGADTFQLPTPVQDYIDNVGGDQATHSPTNTDGTPTVADGGLILTWRTAFTALAVVGAVVAAYFLGKSYKRK